MNASFTCTRRRLLRHLPLGLPIAWAAPGIRYAGATSREGPHPSMRTGLQGAPYTTTLLAEVFDGLEDNAVDINADGIIVGWSQPEGEMASLAVVWRDPDHFEVLADLGGMAAEAYAINDSGQIAGVSLNAEGDVQARALERWRDDRPRHARRDQRSRSRSE